MKLPSQSCAKQLRWAEVLCPWPILDACWGGWTARLPRDCVPNVKVKWRGSWGITEFQGGDSTMERITNARETCSVESRTGLTT